MDENLQEVNAPINPASTPQIEEINYEVVSSDVGTQLQLQTFQNWDIFVSHASFATGKDRKLLVEGEREYVEGIVNLLKEKYNLKVFVDLKENSQRNYIETLRALKSSRYGLFICSPRFITRFQNLSPVLCEEIKHFKTMYGHGKPCVIPIIFGVTTEYFDAYSPFSSLDFRIDSHYEDGDLQKMIEKTAITVSEFIKSNTV